MANMKTLTVNGVTYTVDDPDAVTKEQMDSAISQAVKDVVDKTSPAFTANGAIVTCEPVEGYPLEIEWQPKNLFHDIAWFESHGFTLQEDGSWLGKLVDEICFTNTAKQPGSMYLTATMKTDVNTTPFWMRAYYTDGTASETLRFWAADTFATKSIATDPKKTVDYIQWSWGQGGTYYIKDVQISFVDGEYEPYAESPTAITRCGKNMWDPANVYNGYFTGNAIVYSIPSAICYMPCRPNTTYTVSKKSGQRFALGYTTEIPTGDVLVYGDVREDKAERLTYTTGADAAYLVAWVYNGNVDTITADEMFATVQMELGKTATAYEPYEGETFAVGDTVPALSGVNTIYADTGLVTVTGRANPAAIIEKLTNAILSLGGNV